MTALMRILTLFVIAITAVPGAAQEHHHLPQGDLSEMYGVGGETPEQKRAREEQERLAEEKARLEACAKMSLPQQSIPFGYWGYRHLEAHCKGWVQQLLETTGGGCCSGPTSGECRVSKIDPATRTVEIDGMHCPIPDSVKWGAILGLELGFVLVCASKATGAGGNFTCPTVYCIGSDTGT